MAYSVEISRANPTCFVFLLDQSTSMTDPIAAGDGPKRKADAVADALNRLLFELSLKCAKEEGVRDYFHVAVIGYGARVGSAFGGALAGRDLVPLSQVADNPLRVEERAKKVPDGAGGLVETTARFPVWVDPVANGGTPMSQALREAVALVERWVSDRPGCFPPIVINLTDGESTDGDPSEPASRLRALATADGPVLLFNLHVTGGQRDCGGVPVGRGRRDRPVGRVRTAAVQHVVPAAAAHARVRDESGCCGLGRQPRLRVQRRHHVRRPVPRHRHSRDRPALRRGTSRR